MKIHIRLAFITLVLLVNFGLEYGLFTNGTCQDGVMNHNRTLINYNTTITIKNDEQFTLHNISVQYYVNYFAGPQKFITYYPILNINESKTINTIISFNNSNNHKMIEVTGFILKNNNGYYYYRLDILHLDCRYNGNTKAAIKITPNCMKIEKFYTYHYITYIQNTGFGRVFLDNIEIINYDGLSLYTESVLKYLYPDDAIKLNGTFSDNNWYHLFKMKILWRTDEYGRDYSVTSNTTYKCFDPPPHITPPPNNSSTKFHFEIYSIILIILSLFI